MLPCRDSVLVSTKAPPRLRTVISPFTLPLERPCWSTTSVKMAWERLSLRRRCRRSMRIAVRCLRDNYDNSDAEGTAWRELDCKNCALRRRRGAQERRAERRVPMMTISSLDPPDRWRCRSAPFSSNRWSGASDSCLNPAGAARRAGYNPSVTRFLDCGDCGDVSPMSSVRTTPGSSSRPTLASRRAPRNGHPSATKAVRATAWRSMVTRNCGRPVTAGLSTRTRRDPGAPSSQPHPTQLRA